MKQKEFEELMDIFVNSELSNSGKWKLKKYIEKYDFDELLNLKQENEVLKAKILTYEEIIKKSNFSPFVINNINEIKVD